MGPAVHEVPSLPQHELRRQPVQDPGHGVEDPRCHGGGGSPAYRGTVEASVQAAAAAHGSETGQIIVPATRGTWRADPGRDINKNILDDKAMVDHNGPIIFEPKGPDNADAEERNTTPPRRRGSAGGHTSARPGGDDEGPHIQHDMIEMMCNFDGSRDQDFVPSLISAGPHYDLVINNGKATVNYNCLLYTSDAADE